MQVIEIGAGTASTPLPVLQQLGQDRGEALRFSQWTFTDISAGWFENARNILHHWKSRVEYKVLDIDNDPIEQGFDVESYDVVLAVNIRCILSSCTVPYFANRRRRSFTLPRISTGRCNTATSCSGPAATLSLARLPTPTIRAASSSEPCPDGGPPRTEGKTDRCYRSLNGTRHSRRLGATGERTPREWGGA